MTPAQPPTRVGERTAAERDDAADDRDSAADGRDDAADVRDDAADVRDDAADVRDIASNWRDVVAARRDAAADERDADASRQEQVVAIQQEPGPGRADAVRRAALARRAAASDRLLAYSDRRAGADERHEAEQDRSTSNADRDSGAAEREQSETDRGRAGQDRGAAAGDRHHASLDGLTGAYVRSAGLLELEREVRRARRLEEPLTLAFLGVRLHEADAAGRDGVGGEAGDRLLVRVAEVLRARLRPYDLVVRYGRDELVCGLPGMSAAEAENRLADVHADLALPGSVTVAVLPLRPGDGLGAVLDRGVATLQMRTAVRPEPSQEPRS